jgi:hypothetical protein
MLDLTEKQASKLSAWLNTLEPPPPTAIGGAVTYCLTPCNLGVILKVRYWDGQELDLTEYEDW